MDGIIGLNGENLTPEQRSIENAKQSILIIENFFFAMKEADVPLHLAQQAIDGMNFMKQMHDKLLMELGPEEIEKLKQFANQPKKMPAGIQ